VLKSFAWLPESGLLRDPRPADFARIIEGPQAVLWVDIERGTPEDFAILRQPFGIHPVAIEECRDYTPLPKIEDFGAYVLVILHRVQFDEKTREAALREIDFVVGRNWIITVRQDSSTSVDEVQRKLKSQPDLLREGPGRLLAEIVDVLTSKYFPMVEFLEREVDLLEEGMLQRRYEEDPFGRILALRRTVVALRRTLVPQREVIHRLGREEIKLVSGNAALRLRTTHDELYWILTELEIHRELLTSAFEGHAAMTSNRLAELSNRMNAVMERLSRFATVFMPLSLIAGIYGMNFVHMPELHWKFGYPAVLTLIATLGIWLSRYFARAIPAPLLPPEVSSRRVMTKVWKRPLAGPPPAGEK